MKKSKIFATVVYFIFTFGIGLVFALTLPGYFATFTAPAEVISDALKSGDFITGIVLTEPVGFNRKPVLESNFEQGGGIILYETVMEVYDRDTAQDSGAAANGLVHGMLFKCYEGYVYGVDGYYDVFAQQNNGTSLSVTAEDGKETKLSLLDYDADGNGTNDGISNYTQSGFIVVEIRDSDVSSVKTLRFTDKTGEVVLTAEAEQSLAFGSGFFDCFGDIAAYNQLVAAGNKADISAEESARIIEQRNDYVNAVTEALEAAPDCSVTAKSEEYKAAVDTVNGIANRKAIPFIVVYFVAIYIIADFLLGSHLIIKFFKWFLFKVCKIPHKEKQKVDKADFFGHDYFSMVTVKLDLSEVPEFNGSVEIKYTNTSEEAVFTLLKSEDYTATVRLKAGIYVNPFIDIDRAYAPVDLPDNLEVEGYQMEKTIKIVKREG